MLYDSLHHKILKLADSVLVYPAHGAGSLCGRNMRAERVSTIGTERLTNYALQIEGRVQFVEQLTSNLPARPDYFLMDAEMNRTGASALAELSRLRPMDPGELKIFLQGGGLALDVRPGEKFAAGHVPGSVNIALSGQFASWAGALLGLAADPVLISESEDELSEARMRLARVGLENARGFLKGGTAAWREKGLPLETQTEIPVETLHERLRGGIQILDVRRESEWETGHIDGAVWWPLDNFKVAPPEIDRSAPVAVHCKGGYRSMIACSLLRRAGFANVINVTGGFDAWQHAKLPVVVEKPAAV
jgi:rhodanese-related sulfurtransferase